MRRNSPLDLDVDAPEKAWQDPHAGRIWSKLAQILDAAADRAERAVTKEFGA